MRVYTLLLSLLLTCIIQAQVTPAEKAALQAFYTATGGSNWTSETDADPTNDWDFSGPVTNDWYGITISGGNVIQLLLDNNSNSGNNLMGTIPTEFGNLQYLIDLDLSDQNNLTGPIPDSFGNLLNLKTLLLNNNQFTGLIPPVLGNLSNLNTLWLSANNFIGQIPSSLGNLGFLESLLLAGNQLTGDIPVELGGLNNLLELQLSYNELTGKIPSELGLLSNLITLSLRYNNLTGEIPETIYGLTNLVSLLLEFNKLEGVISPMVGNLVVLEKLILRNNQFVGNLPEEIGTISSLLILMLGHNNFTGTIPDSFSGLTNLGTFEINDNDIEGVLPAGLVNWTNISSLDLMNNRIEGDIPSFVFLNTTIIRIYGNRFQFGDFEDEFSYYEGFTFFVDNPQAKVNSAENLSSCAGSSITLSTVVSGNANLYQWLKDGTAIAGAINADLVINPVTISDAGVYTCLITSTIVTDLTLERNPITLTVNTTGPIANIVEDKLACDLDADGFATFSLNLADIEAQAFGSQTGLTISYFDSLGNPLTLTNSYTNTTASNQVVTVRVSDTGGCYDEITFNLITTLPAVADTNADVTSCVNYTLPPLNADSNYFTATNASGTPLQEGAIINTTQTIYIHAGIGNCADETSFTVTIEQPVTADQLEDVTECEFYTLPPLPQVIILQKVTDKEQ
ncbi:leucine-rich repeat domain-containing protein [Cellulophaga baltica]|uniref:leucine-rich repeat domain-containing protein n=1 Tax=Cellulophaga baltica TaxID=76594 RepID=UPI0037CC209C